MEEYMMKNKKVKNDDDNNDNNNCDRLSSLPDAILANILSLTPIKTAVSSGILSKRWYNLWTQTTSCKLDKNYGGDFFAVANNLFFKLTSLELERIELVIPTIPGSMNDDDDDDDDDDAKFAKRCSYYLETWVSFLYGRNVKELSISTSLEEMAGDVYRWPASIQLHPCVFESRTLVSLELGVGFRYRLHRHTSLPNLKKLSMWLYMKSDRQQNFVEKLVDACPMLEDLSLFEGPVKNHYYHKPRYPRVKARCLKLSSKCLKMLKLTILSTGVFEQVVMNVPNLQYIDIDDDSFAEYQFVETPEGLVSSIMKFGRRNIYNMQHRLYADLIKLRSFQSIKSLLLPDCVFNALEGLDDNLVPVLPSLTSLTIWLHSMSLFCMRLMRFLNCCPNLMEITLEDISELDKAKIGATGICTHTPLDVAPCLLTEVKTIKLRNVKICNDRLTLLKFILSSAQVLELLHVDVDSSTFAEAKFENKLLHVDVDSTAFAKGKFDNKIGELEFCEELYNFTRSSVECQIDFCGNHLDVSSKSGRIEKLAWGRLRCSRE